MYARWDEDTFIPKTVQKRKRRASLRGVTRLSGLTACLAPISPGHFVFEVYLVGDSNQPRPCGLAPYLGRPLSISHIQDTSFLFCGVPLRRTLIFLGQPSATASASLDLSPRFIFNHPSASTTFRLHELQGGTTSFGDLRLRSPLDFHPGSRPFQRFTARRASFGTAWL